MAKKKQEMNLEEVEKITEEYKDKKNFSMKDTIKLMKKSSLSYKQLNQAMTLIAKETERLAEEAEARGEEFDRQEFLKQKAEGIINEAKKSKKK